MRNETRQRLAGYFARQAELNQVELTTVAGEKKFTVTPSVQQTLENKVQESSAFLQRINIVPVLEMRGEKLGLGVSGTIASTTDTTTKDRETQDISTLGSNTYECGQINHDSHITYGKLDMWAKFPDFQQRISTLKAERMALDRIMIGFNGTKRAKTSNRTTNQLLQDVGIGWLEQIRTNAKNRYMKEETESSGKIQVGKGQTYQSLDALVYSAVSDLIAPWCQDDTQLVAIMSRDLLADKYFPLINNNADKPSEQLAGDLVISQKRVGGLQAVQAPFVPAGTILITRLDNLSIYYQEGAMRRALVDNAKRDRIEDYLSSNDAYVIENYDCVALLENIELKDKA
ncbi:capsid protein [Pasteurellaceae bacterium Macca]|nr:capsid protein [Pasteurellaceae bacterium Macca]